MARLTTSNSSVLTDGVPDPLAGRLSRGLEGVLWTLPEAMTDPFGGLRGRLKATLESYRFNAVSGNVQKPRSPRSLLDWAIGQTRVDDPLVHYSRQELEQAFARFSRDRDAHLGQLVEAAKKEGKGSVVAQVMQEISDPAMRRGLEEAMRRAGL